MANRTVGAASLLQMVVGAVSLGSTYIIPLYCAQIQGYNAEQIGYGRDVERSATAAAVPRHAVPDEALRSRACW